jgi:hypothetical protein
MFLLMVAQALRRSGAEALRIGESEGRRGRGTDRAGMARRGAAPRYSPWVGGRWQQVEVAGQGGEGPDLVRRPKCSRRNEMTVRDGLIEGSRLVRERVGKARAEQDVGNGWPACASGCLPVAVRTTRAPASGLGLRLIDQASLEEGRHVMPWRRWTDRAMS